MGLTDNYFGERGREFLDDTEHVLMEDISDRHGHFEISLAKNTETAGIPSSKTLIRSLNLSISRRRVDVRANSSRWAWVFKHNHITIT